MVKDRADEAVTPVQTGSGNGASVGAGGGGSRAGGGSDPPSREGLQLSRSLRRTVSQVKEEAQDFLLLTEQSRSKLKERRRSVLSKRYNLKTCTPDTTPKLTKPSVLQLVVEGCQKLQKKTRSIMGRETPTEKQSEIAMYTAPLAEHRMALFPESRRIRMQAMLRPELEGRALLDNLIDVPTADDEPDSATGHSKGKNWLWCRGTAPEDLKKQKRQVSVTQGLKKFLQMQTVDAIEYRPIFTYYVTVAQLLILVFSLSIYGFGPWGFTKERRANLVMVTSLTLENVDVEEPQNIWFGNREADLIHLGARFTPCIRDDPGIRAEIVRDVNRERETACCVRHDRSGCVQTQKDQCSENLSTWHRKIHHGSLVGSVCGQDPRYCNEPASIEPYRWPEDFTKWPKCRKQHVPSSVRGSGSGAGDLSATGDAHMACQVVGRPCCLGTYGQCEITTREYCDFVRGTFHEEAALCSQVSCLSDVCGMFPFIRSPDRPDQFYRLVTSLFLHAGIIHFALTCFLQMRWMRDVEKIYGPHRIGTIYMLSGVGGNLASASFVPYRADVGPSAALFGIMAIFIVELWEMWDEIADKRRAVCHAVAPILVGLVCGFTPWTDNFGHVFGLIIGVVLATMPHGANHGDARFLSRRWFFGLVTLITIFSALTIWFYYFPYLQCSFCHYFTCLPQLFQEACETHSVNYKPRMKIHF
ncbi:inactive rhomboid protein 1-like isoform X2 [Varroa jacobsoni]|uniref:Peptidase S54 rhomboid domain-containing protein n=1 Tax=Varroa destructor TaxID=109461 RepID=A0A7M7JUM6_VARDE|nr:inactive rhomboid protein 1-like isoform X2 [Varroa destructor]XP_022698776.1 inactive rhomboid protein 1-like isoform X2 [Varroa jacobsoni]